MLPLAVVLVAVGCGGSMASDSPPAEPQAEAEEPSTAPARLDDELLVPTTGWATDFSKHTIPLSEIGPGGPGKDGIPTIDEPKFVPVQEADEWLGAHEPVIELELGGDARAYPLQIVIWHEIVNDEVGGTPVSVTFCPLCNTALVFDRRLDDRVLDFGTTGNLRNSDLVMYDRQTESWWQQFGGEAIVGELAGKELEQIPAAVVAWEDFARRHPDGTVLSRDTGHSRPYGQNPYTGYDDIDTPPFFPAANSDDDRLPPKERVVFVERGEEAVVVPFSLLERKKTVEVMVGGERLEVSWVPGVRSALDSASIAAAREVGSADVRSLETGETVAFDLPFWFAVAAFRPNAEIAGQ
jgi:hypothetical protein